MVKKEKVKQYVEIKYDDYKTIVEYAIIGGIKKNFLKEIKIMMIYYNLKRSKRLKKLRGKK